MMQVMTVPLFGESTRRPGGAATKDQKYSDVVFDLIENASSGRRTFMARSRPGLQGYGLGTNWVGTPNGVIGVPGDDSSTTPDVIYATLNGSNWELYTFDGGSTHTQIGSGTLATTHEVDWISETTVSGTRTMVYVSTGGNAAYHSTTSGGSFTKITNANFPANASRTIVGPAAHVGGFMAIMDTTGRAYVSDLNSVSSYTANSYFTANQSPDGGVGVFAYRGNHLACFGKNSVEFARNTGNTAGSPFTIVQGQGLDIGAQSAEHVCEYGGSLAFIGNAESGSGVYALNGLDAKKLSSDHMDRLIHSDQLAGFLSEARLVPLNMGGRSMLALVLRNNGTWMFDPLTGAWSSLQKTMTYARRTVRAASGQSFVGIYKSFSPTYGGVGELKETVTQDTLQGVTTATIAPEMIIGPIQFGSHNRVVVDYIRLIGDQSSSTFTVNVEISFDDGSNYASARSLDMSSKNPEIRACGIGRRMTVKLSAQTAGSSGYKFRGQAMEIGYTPCAQ